MKLLLDTHIILWSVAEPERLPASVALELESDANELWFSPISVWEIALLAEKGRLKFRSDPNLTVRNMFDRLPMKEAVINKEVAIMSREVDLPHQDPADRFLGATAAAYDLILVTADRRLMYSRSFRVLQST
ncbi:MAG: type II toxin-antitoxin system VapC family toxin [Deltaproteobacteria bacterium]|nr:type II toxin-antitoxin system VapC family toxin [Deltaproteobacteria bacterium]